MTHAPRAEARRRAMRRQFDALGVQFEILDAIDRRYGKRIHVCGYGPSSK